MPDLDLTPPQRIALDMALCAAFPTPAALRRRTACGLDCNLEEIAPAAELPTVRLARRPRSAPPGGAVVRS